MAIDTVNSSDIKAHGKDIPFSYIPLVINRKDMEFFDSEIGKVQKILNKMTRRYVADPEYRKIFGFSGDMEKLICLPCNYDEIIPIGRYDIFYDENTGDYQFCEFNTDGSGGMSRDYEMSRAILNSCISGSSRGNIIFDDIEVSEIPYDGKTLRNQMTGAELLKPESEKTPGNSGGEAIDMPMPNGEGLNPPVGAEPLRFKLSVIDTIGIMADEMIRIYRSSEGAVEHPLFCVTDFREEGVFSDFNRFIRAFNERGIEARFTDIRDLVFDGDRLYDRTDGKTIHGIYRRAVTSVVLTRMDECRGLIAAIEAKKVVLMGHFRTSLAHSKVVLSAMHHPLTLDMLDACERDYVNRHVPLTLKFNSDHVGEDFMEKLVRNKDEWLIKPEEGFASHGVVCGRDLTDDEWAGLLSKRFNGNDVVQKFCRRYEVPLLGPQDEEITMYPLMLGIYQAGGRAAGFYSRAGKHGVIDFDHGGICVSTVYADRKE